MKKNAGSVALTVAGAVLCAVFSFLLVCNVTIIVKGTLHPETPPTVLGVAPMVVLSGSMSGTAADHIEVGDLIFTTKPDTEALQVGDVVAFKDGNVVVTHRIVAVTADESGKKQFITKGDANNTEDPAIYPESVIGVYRGRIPKLGDFALFLQKPLGMAVFIRPLVSVEKIQLQIKAQDTEATRWGTKKAVWAKLLILRSFCSHTAKITDRAISRNMWMKV